MALSLDKHVMSNPALSAHVDLKLDFSGFYKDWKSTNVSECQTSSLWSECQVNTYHLCAQVGNRQAAWWRYSACMFAHQYPHEECAGPNPWANATCTPATFPKLLATVSDGCAAAAGLDAAAVKSCVTDGKGVELLKASNKKTVTFPTDKKGYPEPEWVQVDGPSCEKVGWDGCKGSFDKTGCLTWDACDPEAWGRHMAAVVCKKAGLLQCP